MIGIKMKANLHKLYMSILEKKSMKNTVPYICDSTNKKVTHSLAITLFCACASLRVGYDAQCVQTAWGSAFLMDSQGCFHCWAKN